jgi:hypothetical protein
MIMQFQKATKEQAKLRLALFGPSGSGKTFTSLRIATGMGGPVAFIDTERHTARKYSDRFDFDVLELERRDISAYIEAIQAAQKEGYPVLIIDSLTHAWQELLEEVDKLARSKYGGNRWSAWSDGTPKQRVFIDALLSFDGHVIATMRSNTEWDSEKDDRGKVKPVRVGLKPEQGKDIEYEFDLLMELSPEHVAKIIKDRTGKYQDVVIEMPGEGLGRELLDWLSTGESPAPRPQPISAPLPAPDAPTNGTKRDKLIARLTNLATEITGLETRTVTLDIAWLDTASEAELTAEGMTLRQQLDTLKAAQPEQSALPIDGDEIEEAA